MITIRHYQKDDVENIGQLIADTYSQFNLTFASTTAKSLLRSKRLVSDVNTDVLVATGETRRSSSRGEASQYVVKVNGSEGAAYTYLDPRRLYPSVEI